MDLAKFLAGLAASQRMQGAPLPPQPVDEALAQKDNEFLTQELGAPPPPVPASAPAPAESDEGPEETLPAAPTPTPRTPAATKPTAPASSGPTPPTQSNYDDVKAMIAKKYGIGGDNDGVDALKAAQTEQNGRLASANMGQAFGSIINGLSGGHAPTNNGFYDSLKEQAKNPVRQLIEQRALEQDNLKNAKSIEDLTKETVGNDPNAAINKNFQALLSKVPSLKGVDLSSVTVNNAGPFQKVADAMLAAEARKAQMQMVRDNHQAMIDQRQDRLDQSVHQRNLMAIKRDPNLRQRMQQYQNLDNALNLVTQAHNLTPQQVDDFQQAVRANLGIKGTSGVDERSKTYINSLGLNSARFNQFLTGNPADLAKNSKLMSHLRDLALNEQKNIQSQYLNSLKAAGAGDGSLYRRRPDLAGDLSDLMSANVNQLSSKAGGSNALTAPTSEMSAAPAAAKGKPGPGSIVSVKGKQYRVGADGDSLEPLQ